MSGIITPREVARQRLNYFSAAFISVIGVSLLSELIQEKDLVDKADDVALLGVGLLAVLWYRRMIQKSQRSSMPILVMILAILTKVGAIMVERADAAAVGDDFGVLATLIVALIFVVWQMMIINRHKEEQKAEISVTK